jgi:hypothetical protein
MPVVASRSDVPDNIEEAFNELNMADPTVGYTSEWELKNLSVETSESPVVASESLWDDYGEQKPVVPEELCKDHGRICKKGICKTYAKQLRDAAKAKKVAESPQKDLGKGRVRGRGGRASNTGNCRASSHRAEESGQTRKMGSNGHSSGTSSTPNASSADDDDDGLSVVSGSKGGKRSRSRADSNASATPSVASTNGWGKFSQGPW